VQGAAQQLRAAVEPEAIAGLIEARDDGGLHAEGHHLELRPVAVLARTPRGADADPPALGLSQPPPQVADMARAGGPTDDLEVAGLQLANRQLSQRTVVARLLGWTSGRRGR